MGCTFSSSSIRLYAGDMPKEEEMHYPGMIGLSLSQQNCRHIKHDMTLPFPLPDNTVDIFQAEDVFEHIHYERLVPVFNEILRILKPEGLFRLSLPDYRCDVLLNRSLTNANGEIFFDPGGGGTPEEPGHVWFPRIEQVYKLIENSHFHNNCKIEYLHYYSEDGTPVTKPIDYSKGLVRRTPDFDKRIQNPYRPMSMVIDMIKNGHS